MVIREQLNKQVTGMAEGMVMTVADFDVPREHRHALIKALSQYVQAGVLRKVAKGRYYKPRQSRFGELPPAISEIVKDYLEKDGRTIGYITGVQAFSALGLTTQISSEILIGTNRYRRPVSRRGYSISFMTQPNPIAADDIELFRLLDAIRLVKQIPAATLEDSVKQLCVLIQTLPSDKRKRLADLAMAYQPAVRALLGAILDSRDLPTYGLADTLNPVTVYPMPIPEDVLPTKSKWNIV